MNDSHHWGWLALAFCCVGLAAYLWSVNRPNNESYGKDATHNEQHRQDWPLSIHIGEGGCANLAALRALHPSWSKPDKEVKSDPKNSH